MDRRLADRANPMLAPLETLSVGDQLLVLRRVRYAEAMEALLARLSGRWFSRFLRPALAALETPVDFLLYTDGKPARRRVWRPEGKLKIAPKGDLFKISGLKGGKGVLVPFDPASPGTPLRLFVFGGCDYELGIDLLLGKGEPVLGVTGFDEKGDPFVRTYPLAKGRNRLKFTAGPCETFIGIHLELVASASFRVVSLSLRRLGEDRAGNSAPVWTDLKQASQKLNAIKRAFDEGGIAAPLRELETLRLAFERSRLTELDPARISGFREKLAFVSARILDDKGLLASPMPMPPRRSRPLYDPDPGTIFYLLDSAVPMRTNGYATRSHGLLTALCREGWNAIGVARPGFPLDAGNYPERIRDEGLDAVLGSLPPPEYERDGVRYLRDPELAILRNRTSKSDYIRACARDLVARAAAHRPAVIHAASNFYLGLAGALAARELGIPFVYEVRGLWELTRASGSPGFEASEQFALQAALEARAASEAETTFTITAAVAEILAERGAPRSRLQLLPNAVDPEAFRPAARDAALEQSLRLAGKTVIGYAGSLTEYEDLELLFEAVAGFPPGLLRRVHVLIVGGGPHLTALRGAAAGRKGVPISVVGEVPFSEIQGYYSLFDIVALPRKKCLLCDTVSPLKPFEAMAMEKAVVVSDVRALVEIVRHNETGLVHPAGDAAALRDALRSLVGDPCLRGRLGSAARRWILQERTWENAARQVGCAYRRLTAPNPGSNQAALPVLSGLA